ncbi:unnamed protein product [Lota lota]
MDQRAKGGTPPTASTAKPATPPTPRGSSSEEPRRDRAREKKRSREKEVVENGEVGKDEEEEEEERRGAGRSGPGGDKGAVLELLIEGRCGDTGQRPLLYPGAAATADGPEGNMRLRIGLQAKRTKKPPKMLESYVCKPTFRTYQRQGRAEAQRCGGGEGEVGQQGITSPAPGETVREQGSVLDAIQPQTKQTALTAPSPPSSSSRSLQRPPLSSTAPPASAPASPGTKTDREVSIKPSGKTEANANSPPEKAMRDKLPSISAHSAVTAGHKSCSLKTDQSISPTTHSSTTLSAPTTFAGEPRNEGETHSKHNGLGRQKRPANGKGMLEGCGHARTSKVKFGSISRSSTSTPNDIEPAARLPAVSSNSHKELCRFQKNRADSVCPPSVDPKPRSTSSPPSQRFSGSCDTTQGPPLLDKRKEKKARRGNRKEKKKRDRGEVDGSKSEGGRREEGKKKKKLKEKDRKSRHGKGKEERGRNHGTKREGAENTDRGKIERKRDKLSPESHRGKDKRDEPCEIDDVAKQDRVRKLAIPGEREKVEETTNKTVKEAESATAGDDIKSKEHYFPLRHQPVSPSHRSPLSPPLSHSPPAACSLTSSSTAPQEQDSRPLKKRKARRPSWTKLVHRVQRAENQEAPSDSCNNPYLSLPEKIKTCPSTKSPEQPSDLAQLTTSSSSLPTSSPHRASCRPSSPAHSVSQLHSPGYPMTPARKRGRPKSHAEQLTPRSSPKAVTEDAPRPGCEGAPKAPSPETSPSLQGVSQPYAAPRKRGRPPKRPLPEDPYGDVPSSSEGKGRYKAFNAERGIRQLKIRKLISEIKKKRKRLYTGMRSECGRRREARGEVECEGAAVACRPQDATVNTLSALSPLGDKWGAQINVSKRGTIYMGKRRGRKPKAPAGILNSPLNAQRSPQPPLFTSLSESSLFASHQLQPLVAHPFPSPSLTHSSGAQSPYSEGSFTDPASSSLVFPHPFSLPSPSSSCTSPHPPPPTSSLSPFVKRSCPCQGRLHFPFHQSSCKLSALAPPLHHSPASPAHLKEAIPSPRSESHSEETLPSDSGIGTDNNSVSERGGEMRGGRGVFRTGLILGVQRYPSALAKRPSPVASHLASVHRHTHPIASPGAVERERHRHRRRDFDCVSPCSCMCSCPYQGPNKCTHLDSYPCLGHNTMKKQKSKHKKKHQQLHMHDPEFLAELEDLIGQLGEVHIGRRGWVRAGLGPGLEGGMKVDGGRRHHPSSSHPLRSNIFRINLNGFYSPHPSAYSANPSYSPQPFYSCQPLHCGRKPDRRQCGCPSKFQDPIDDMGFYRGYPPTVPIYPHLHSSYPLPPPHQYVSHQPHHPHFLLNPARFHRRMGRAMRDGGLGVEGEGDAGRVGGGGAAGGPRPGAGFASALGCGCSRAEHKHKRKHRHQHCHPSEEEEDVEEEEEEEEEGVRGALGLTGHKPQPRGYVSRPADGGRKAARDSPWLCKNVRETSSSAAPSVSSLPRLPSERFKQTPLSSLGLGSSHLSSFGGSWGGLGQPWMKTGASGRPGFSLSNPSWSTLASSKRAERSEGSDPEEDDDDEDEFQDSHLYGAPQSPTHINLFTSAAMETGRKGLRIGKEGPGVGEMSWRRGDLAWRERRGTGLQGDLRRRGQQKGVPAATSAAATDGTEVRKRGPGRPRKYPLPVPVPSSTLSSSSPPPPPPPPPPPLCSSSSSSSTYLSTTPLQSPEQPAARSRMDVIGERLAERPTAPKGDCELAAGAKRKRGRKRKNADSLCLQSLSDKPESDDPAEYFDQSEIEQLSPHTSTVQWEKRVDSYPSKTFLSSGLYSDDHKTTDSPTESNPTSKASLEYTEGEREYSLLPAPLHVGKYLRLKRIDFQLPYDVLWLWRHNQLNRQPAVPLKRKRHYCRPKGRTRASHHELEKSSGDMAGLFPHLEMEPMTSTERSFVVKQRVFLVRNWELVRDKQIHLRMERERRRQRAESDAAHRPCSGDDSNIQSDEPLGSAERVISRDPQSRTLDTSSSLTAYPRLTKPQNRREETGEEDKTQEEEDDEVCRRELRKKRLNNLLLALQHS